MKQSIFLQVVNVWLEGWKIMKNNKESYSLTLHTLRKNETEIALTEIIVHHL